ncbi:MAG: DNA primase [Chitinophagaceae bacterium]|nr:DNA primase [Chitinophagaceae bacterium]MCW5904944.1 DNA primase [Chitinophagaceae bacterium]
MITPQTIEQIKSRIDIIDIIGEYVKLKKRGSNYIGLCPFHNEKTPSFSVSASKELYKCFGCGKSGNAITFLMEHDKLSYVETLKWLAAKYNITIEETETSAEQKIIVQTADSLYAINKFANDFFVQELWQETEGQQIALTYLQERGFRDDTIKKFQLGYNPKEKDKLAQTLITHQFNKDILPKTGLVVIRNNDEWTDNYRGRIIFPIHNNTGKIIGFGARVIGQADKAPKYINTPENEIYVKSKILYGLYFARTVIAKEDECLLVEGYTDVISLHQAGIENVVASGGTSLTSEQLRLIKKYTNNLTIIYDGDMAGVKAALRGLDMALEEGLNVKLVLIPDNEDPDSYVNKTGTTVFKQFIAQHKKDFIIFQLEVMLKDAGNDITQKNNVVNNIAATLSKINRAEDFTKLHEYIRQCAELLKIDEAGLTNLVNKVKQEKQLKENKRASLADALQQIPEQEETIPTETLLLNEDEVYEKNMLRVLLEYGLQQKDETQSVANYIFDSLNNFRFDNALYSTIYQEYQELYGLGKEPDTKTFLYHKEEAVRNVIINIIAQPYELSPRWDEKLPGMNIVNRDVSLHDIDISISYFKLRKIKKMFRENQQDLEAATSIEEQLKLIAVHKFLKEEEIAITKHLGTVIIK